VTGTDRDSVAADGGFRLDAQFGASRDDQKAPFSACVLKRNHHECIDQFLEVDLTSDRLRYFDDSGEVQVFDRRPNCAVGMQRC
jgi:hypothetical protein